MIKKIWNWIRSKYYYTYSEITQEDIKNFLTKHYAHPSGATAEKITYLRPSELQTIINAYFKKEVPKHRAHAAFSELKYKTITRRKSIYSRNFYIVIPLVMIKQPAKEIKLK